MFGKFIGAAAFVLALSAADAQTYPSRPISIIVAYAAGSPLEAYARVIAAPLGRQLKQPIIIENVGGAGGNIGAMRALKAAPDGYTILYHNIAMATNPALYRKLDYNPVTDFEPIALLTFSQSVLLARLDLPVRDFAEFQAYARANGDKLTLADAGVGGPSYLCGLLFMAAVGTRFTTVSYKGTAPAMHDLLGGRVDLLCDASATGAPQIRAGKVKALGLTGRSRLPFLPGVPTLEEQGLKGFEMVTWTAMYAPRNTPKSVVDPLVAALQASLAEPNLVAAFEKMGVQTAPRDSATPAGLQAHLKAEIEKWGPVIRKAGTFAD